MRSRFLRPALLVLVFLALSLPGIAQVSIPDFSFVHMSDIHAARSDSRDTIATLVNLGEVALTPYNVTAPAPSFIIATGDLTEFGGGYGNSWDALMSYTRDIRIPIYWASGNHDGTWDNMRPAIRKINGNAFYSFDYNKVHFIILDSSGLQDPRPTFTVEELNWLAEDIKKLDASTPVIVAFHHPLPGSEFPSEYDYNRLMDILHPYNVIAMLVGHGHASTRLSYDGYDELEGGSTFGKAGYSIISIQNGVLRAAYRSVGESDAKNGLIEKQIPAKADYAKITILSPDPKFLSAGLGDLASSSIERVKRALTATVGTIPARNLKTTAKIALLTKNRIGSFTKALEKEFRLPINEADRSRLSKATIGDVAQMMDASIQRALIPKITISAQIESVPDEVVSAEYVIDSDIKGSLTQDGTLYKADYATDQLTPGVHSLKVSFTCKGGRIFQRSSCFHVENGKVYARWRTVLGGSSKSAPTIADGVVYVGATDGKLYAFDARTGEPKWSFTTGGEILGQALVVEKTVYIGSADARLYAIDAVTGKQRWAFEADKAVFSSPVYAEGKVLFGCNSGAFYALDAETGSQIWVNRDATYAVEIKPYVLGSTVYYGAWDANMYAVNIADGTLVWKKPSAGATSGAARYYSPADCGPVGSGNRVFCADRNSKFTIFDAATGSHISSQDRCSGTGISEDGQAIYLRKGDGNLVKTDLDGKQIWAVDVKMGYVPVAPVEKDGAVYVCSGAGLTSAVSASDGAVRWQYRATPLLWVMSPVSAWSGMAYVSGMDGTLTAIASR